MSTVEMSVFEMHVVKMPVFVISMADMSFMKNTYCLFQIKFITEYQNVQHIIITQI